MCCENILPEYNIVQYIYVYVDLDSCPRDDFKRKQQALLLFVPSTHLLLFMSAHFIDIFA